MAVFHTIVIHSFLQGCKYKRGGSDRRKFEILFVSGGFEGPFAFAIFSVVRAPMENIE
jgi:hypothetical protein